MEGWAFGQPFRLLPWAPVPIQLHGIKTTREDLLVTPATIFMSFLETQLTMAVRQPSPLPAPSGQSEALRRRGERAGVGPGRWWLEGLRMDLVPSREPLEHTAVLRVQHCPLPPVPPTPPAGSDSWPPAMDPPPPLQTAPPEQRR